MNIGSVAQAPDHHRRWTFIAHLDATARDLEPWETREAIDLQNNPTPHAHMVVQVRRKSVHPLREKILGVAQILALPVSIAASVAATALCPSPVSTVLALDLVSTGAALAYKGMQRLRYVNELPTISQEPQWNGTRTYDFGAPVTTLLARASATTDNPAHLAATPISTSPSTARPQPAAVANLIAEQSAAHPSDQVVFLLSGHAGVRRVAGLSPRELGQALAQAHEQSGKKIDLVILEGCQSGNLETLQHIQAHARYALVSEERISGANLPWPYLLQHLDQIENDPAALGRTLVQWVGGSEKVSVPTLSLIDLAQVTPLAQSLETLAGALDTWRDAGHGPDIRSCINHTRHFPRETNWLKRLYTYPDTFDLGQFLQALQARSTDPAVQSLARDTGAHLRAAVVANQVAPAYQGEASGIAVRDESPTFFEKNYVANSGLPQWGHLIQRMRPWQTRVATTVLEGAWSTLKRLG